MSKISESLSDVGRAIPYHPNLRRVIKSVTAIILFEQLFYWSDKGYDESGWIVKTVQELELETGLSYKEQLVARKLLKSLGILEEKTNKLQHELYFRIKNDRLDTLWEKSDKQAKLPEMTKGNVGSDQRSSRECPKVMSLYTKDYYNRLLNNRLHNNNILCTLDKNPIDELKELDEIENVTSPLENNIKNDKELSESEWVLIRFNELCGTKYRITDKKKEQLRKRLKVFTKEEIESAIIARKKDPWHIENGWTDDWDSLFRNDEKIERFIAKTPAKDKEIDWSALSDEEAMRIAERDHCIWKFSKACPDRYARILSNQI